MKRFLVVTFILFSFAAIAFANDEVRTIPECSSTIEITSCAMWKLRDCRLTIICRDNVITVEYNIETQVTTIITTHGYYRTLTPYSEIKAWLFNDVT